MTPGIIPYVVDALKETTKDWQLQDRACTLIFDEMSLKENLQYNPKNDLVLGYSDNGEERTAGVANTALVILLAGISKSWVQPVAFTVARTKTSAETIEKLVITLIKQLQQGQLFVKGVICDQGASNVVLAGRLNVTPAEPFFW